MTPPAATPTDTTAAARTTERGEQRNIPRRNRRRVAGLVIVGLLVVATGVVFSVGFGRDPSVVRSVLINKPAPALSGTTLDRAPLDLRRYRGKVVLVNVWASWCAACREEHPVLTAVQRAYADRGLQIIGIDMSDTRVDAEKFLTEMGGAPYPSVFDPRARIAIRWGTFGVPETYLIDRNGTIREKAVGPITTRWVNAHVTPLLEKS